MEPIFFDDQKLGTMQLFTDAITFYFNVVFLNIFTHLCSHRIFSL